MSDPPARQNVKVGYGLLAALGDDDVMAAPARSIFRMGLATRQPRTSWTSAIERGPIGCMTFYTDTRWTDTRHTRLCTTIGLAAEWRALRAKTPPEYDDEQHRATATRV